jgi:Zn-finger nucleic acid-binding protein
MALEDLATMVVKADAKEKLRCPSCPQEMVRQKYQSAVPVTVDQCPRCQFIWLDAGELALLRRLYAEMLTSTDPRLMAIRDRLAVAQGRVTREKGDPWPPPTQGGEMGGAMM